VARPTVREVVAVDARDDHVVEVQLPHRAPDVLGLVRVGWRGRLDGLHGTESAAPRALVPEHHQGHRGVIALPALADIRAAGLLADGVEVELAGEPLEPSVALPTG